MKWSHSIVLFKAGCSIQRGTVPEGMFFRDFCLEHGPLPIHIEVERRAPPEAFFKKQYRISPVEAENFLAPSLWSIWIFCNLVGCNGRRQWHPTLVLLPGKSHGQRSLVGFSPWGCKELDTTEQLSMHACTYLF